MLADAGCPLGSQTVLLKGVNDDPAIMKRLMQELLKCRVRPYYLYQADLVAGGEHFRTSVAKGLEIIEALRGWTSGLAVPHFVIDAPGGGGKIPLLPDVRAVDDRPGGRAAELRGQDVPVRPAEAGRLAAAGRASAAARPAEAPRRGRERSRGEPPRRPAPLTAGIRGTAQENPSRAVTLRQGDPAPPELRADRLGVGALEPVHPLPEQRLPATRAGAVAAPPSAAPPRSRPRTRRRASRSSMVPSLTRPGAVARGASRRRAGARRRLRREDQLVPARARPRQGVVSDGHDAAHHRRSADGDPDLDSPRAAQRLGDERGHDRPQLVGDGVGQPDLPRDHGLPAVVAPCGEREQPEDHAGSARTSSGSRSLRSSCWASSLSCPLRHRSGGGVKRRGRRARGGAATGRERARGRPGSRPGLPRAGSGRRGPADPGRRWPSRARWRPGPSRGSGRACPRPRGRGQDRRCAGDPGRRASSSTSTVAPAR